jgi:DNA-binding MarR family transcriptional regulator
MSVHKCPIIPGSISEVVVNYLYMRARSSKGPYAAREEIFDLAPNKFKKIDNVQRSLDRLKNMGFVYKKINNSNVQTWALTKEGIALLSQVANLRRQSAPKRVADEDDF